MYNGINNGAGDAMINQEETGALVNQIYEVTRDHIDWIKTQLLKSNNFMVAKGREVWIDVPNSKLKNIITIPNKNDEDYRQAWVRVYNLAVDYLEGSLSYACMKGELDYRIIKWPEFNSDNADYARGLETILIQYRKKQEEKLKQEQEKPALFVKKSSVVLEPVKMDLNLESREFHRTQAESLENQEEIENQGQDKIEEVETSQLQTKVNHEFVFQKLLDGDAVTNADFSNLKNGDFPFVVVPCQNVDNIKEEKLFLENMRVCDDEGVKTGAMIYGSASDEREATYELKTLFKLLEQCGNSFTKTVIYEVNDDFVLKNKDSEMKLLSFINAYTMIAEGLAKEGYLPLLSMNFSSKKILSDIYNRYNLNSKCEIIYRVLVRELEELDKGDSSILMDPQYDYDVITLRNPRFDNGDKIRNIIESSLVKNTTFAKAA